jgi:hypothetical protein
MGSLLTRIITFLFFCSLATSGFAFESDVYKLLPPKNRTEEPNLFGSDVIFVKNRNPGDSPIFVKFIDNKAPLGSPESFLIEKVKNSKSFGSPKVSTILKKNFNGQDFYYTTFQDIGKNQKVLSGLFKKDLNRYVFIFLKSEDKHFDEESEMLLLSLESFRFK